MSRGKEIIAYLFWGGMTTLVSWGTYSAFIFVFRGIDAQIRLFGLRISGAIIGANILSWIFAVAFAFVANKLWVFKSKSWKTAVFLRELWKFILARIATGIFEMVSVPLLEGLGVNGTILGIDGAWAKIIVSVVVVILNYVLSKLFIF